jgi:pantothenate kinase-related protein Tda10
MGTREDVLDKIIAWVNQSDEDTESPRVMVLCGAPGSGKSAIAHTVAKRFDELKRLGSSFFFIHDHPERRLDNLFSTVTRDLADLDPQWRKALSTPPFVPHVPTTCTRGMCRMSR